MPVFQVNLADEKLPGLEFYRNRHNVSSGTNLSNLEFLNLFISTWTGKGIRFSKEIKTKEISSKIDKLSADNKDKVMRLLDSVN